MPKMNLDWKTAHDFLIDAFKGCGVPADDCEIVADIILESDRRRYIEHAFLGVAEIPEYAKARRIAELLHRVGNAVYRRVIGKRILDYEIDSAVIMRQIFLFRHNYNSREVFFI